MKEKEKTHGPSEAKAMPSFGGGINPLLGEAAKLLAAGDEIIARTLSGNSEDFLQANRQSGGQ